MLRVRFDPCLVTPCRGTGQGSVRNVYVRRYLVLVVDIVVIVEDFFQVVLIFVTVDAQGGDLIVGFEEGIFVGFEGVGDFYVCLIDGGVVLAGSVDDGGQVRLQRVMPLILLLTRLWCAPGGHTAV